MKIYIIIACIAHLIGLSIGIFLYMAEKFPESFWTIVINLIGIGFVYLANYLTEEKSSL